MSTATCKGCGARLIWVRSKAKDKWIPCDEVLKAYKQDDFGKEVVITPDGDYIRCSFEFEGLPTGMAYVPHWATCPEAERFRRKRRAGG